ncbi:MAG: RsmB/NOP family class I SAM-dependent RNA methyltransferase [Actinomycetales bacterium]
MSASGPERRGRRPAPRSAPRSAQRPAERARSTDPARRAAYDVLRAVAERDAYANLVLPGMLRARSIRGRDAAFATELTYGTLRWQGTYDAVLAACLDKPLTGDIGLRLALRLGAHQLLGMRVQAHAAVSETVGLVREVVGIGPGGLANAVLRRVAERSLDAWVAELAPPVEADLVGHLALAQSHPPWIVRAMRDGLAAHDRSLAGDRERLDAELAAVLAADNAPPAVTLVARPGLVTPEELAGSGLVAPGRWSPYALVAQGDPGAIAAVRDGRAAVQDEGSQLVALALAGAGLEGPDRLWLDLCAGPGGKAGLLGALARERGARLVANEVAPHRAELVRQAVVALGDAVEVREGDGRELGRERPGAFDRVLVDVPCTGLGALRRRPESRWRRQPGDVGALARLQRELLGSALDAARPGGLVAYVTCSPHVGETLLVVQDVLRRRDDVEQIEARAAVVGAASAAEALDLGESMQGTLGDGPAAQLWPHRHGTDAMFLALLRRR